jgi:hypothetical protein
MTAPLGLIGATGALLISNRPFGFVALLGLIALAGMIMRNAVILVDQIDRDIAAGRRPLLGDSDDARALWDLVHELRCGELLTISWEARPSACSTDEGGAA